MKIHSLLWPSQLHKTKGNQRCSILLKRYRKWRLPSFLFIVNRTTDQKNCIFNLVLFLLYCYLTVQLKLPFCFDSSWNNRQICSKIGDPFIQTDLGRGIHVDETAALFSDLVQSSAQLCHTVVSSATTRGRVCSTH